MGLDYDSHPEDRVYDFNCTRCRTTVRIFEEIHPQARRLHCSDGYLLELLTMKEEEEQIIDMETSRMFLGELPDLAAKIRQKENKLRNFLYRKEITLKTILFQIQHDISKGARFSSVANTKNRAGSPDATSPVLGPDKCLERHCRICGNQMRLEYRWNSRERQYYFGCARCGTIVRLVEDIIREMREDYRNDGCVLEPLTGKEEVLQTVMGQAGEWFYEKFLLRYRKDIRTKRSVRDRQERNRFSDDETESLR